MESTLSVSVTKRRPGGRTAAVTERIHQAVLALLLESGVDACTFGAVSERAGIERSTLYRRYADRWEMIIDAIVALVANDVLPDLTGNFAADLKSVLSKLVVQLESPLGPAIVAVAAALRANDAQAFPRDFFDQRLAQLNPMFDAAIARGDLKPDVDRLDLFSFAAGSVWFRLFIAARPVDEEVIERIVATVCRAYCRRAALEVQSGP